MFRKVLATAWDAQLGGRDFDRRIQKHFTEVFKVQFYVTLLKGVYKCLAPVTCSRLKSGIHLLGIISFVA